MEDLRDLVRIALTLTGWIGFVSYDKADAATAAIKVINGK